MWLYVVLLHETVLLIPNLCLQHLAFPNYEFLKVVGLQFGCDSSKIIKFDCFWSFVVVKRQLGNVICAILMALMETHRWVPWLRKSDNRTDCEGRAARGKSYYIEFSNFLKHWYQKVLVIIKVPQWAYPKSIN